MFTVEVNQDDKSLRRFWVPCFTAAGRRPANVPRLLRDTVVHVNELVFAAMGREKRRPAVGVWGLNLTL